MINEVSMVCSPTLEELQPTCHVHARQTTVLTPQARRFVAGLVREFRPAIAHMLGARRARQARLDAGASLDFAPETEQIRAQPWRVRPAPPDLVCRHVEITGPVDRKMVINGLNAGADVFMADFEDATSPTFANIIAGQINLYDAVRRTIDYDDPERGRRYSLVESPATLIVRPRGLHLAEHHLLLDGEPVPACLVDFGLYLFHNAHALIDAGSGPYFYLPKLEHHLEARLWNDIFEYSQQRLGLARGTIRATVLIETLPAAFQMDEILYELRDHVCGLNCGRWDYIFSTIKTFARDSHHVLPDRATVDMTTPMMHAYSRLLIDTCHRRGAHAMGGMAAQIPNRHDPVANDLAFAAVRADKLREVSLGHDGTWVAHPALVPVARDIFAEFIRAPHQIDRPRDEEQVTAADLLQCPSGPRTVEGFRHCLRVSLRYLEAWLSGRGCVPLYGLMEDAATAEICRAQMWQWIHHGVRLDDGRIAGLAALFTLFEREFDALREEVGVPGLAGGRYREARTLLWNLVTAPTFVPFFTLAAYEQITTR